MSWDNYLKNWKRTAQNKQYADFGLEVTERIDLIMTVLVFGTQVG